MHRIQKKIAYLKKQFPSIISFIFHHKTFVLSTAVFLFISISTILTLDQVQQRQITNSQAQASQDTQPGGACDGSVNKGCGGAGGCRHWEKCTNNACIDTTNLGKQAASADACGDAAFAPVQSTPNPQPTQGSGATSAPAQPPAAGGSCDNMNWYCLGECANSEARNAFGGNWAEWRRQKAINKNQPGACAVVGAQPTQAQTQPTSPPVQYSDTSCYVGTTPYSPGYCSPTSAGSPYLYCNNEARLTPNTSQSTYIGWVHDTQGTKCAAGSTRCIANGFAPSGGFPCCSGNYFYGVCMANAEGGANPNPTNSPSTPIPPTNTPLPSSTIVPTSTKTPTPSQTSIPIPTNTSVPAPTNAPTNTPVPIATSTHTPTPTNAPTNTPVPLATSTHTPTPTNAHTPIPTSTHTPIPTNTPVPPTSTPSPTITNTPVPPSPTRVPPTNPPTPTISPTPTPILCMPTIDRLVSEVREYKASIYPKLVIKLGIYEQSAFFHKFANEYPMYRIGKEDVLLSDFAIFVDPPEFWATVSTGESCRGSAFCQTWNVEKIERQQGSCQNNSEVLSITPLLKHELIHNIQFSNNQNIGRYIIGSDKFNDSEQINLRKFYTTFIEGVAYGEGNGLSEDNVKLHSGNIEHITTYYLLRNWALARPNNSGALTHFNLAGRGYWNSFCKLRDEYLNNPLPEYLNTVDLLKAIGFQNVKLDQTDSHDFTLQDCIDY